MMADSTAVYLLDGTYHNNGYGTGAVDNSAALTINGYTDVLVTNLPGHSPKIVFDGGGGISARNVVNFTVSGLQVDGMNQYITKWQATQNRLLQDSKFTGRGIAVWSGSYIHIHHNVVHNCPNSGIRANSADYVTIEDNIVGNNTWWSSNAESGIVLADCSHIDQKDIVKLVIRRNTVYDNINKIPYYNRNYDNATYMAENQYSSVREHYGTSLQTFIIDGSGVYVTRNKASYLYGRFELSDNIAYGNGINGLVVHKTDRAIVINNHLSNNGAVPKTAPELRQSYAGLTMNQADNLLRLENNYVTTTLEADYGFVLDSASTLSPDFTAGAGNYICAGMVNNALGPYVSYSDFCIPSPPAPPAPPFPPPCVSDCTDTSPGEACATWTWALSNRCNRNAAWAAARYCEISCQAAGVGYDPACCPPSPPPPSPSPAPPPAPPPCKADCTDTRAASMISGGQYCDTWSYVWTDRCNANANWRTQRYCEITCMHKGVGYTDPPCCPSSPPAAPPPCIECTDTRSDSMIASNQHCNTWSYAYTSKCNLDSYWRSQRYCEISCEANGVGYGNCCPPAPPAPPPPCIACTDTSPTSQPCAGWTWAFSNRCNKHSSWVTNRFCEISCEAAGVGYSGTCCAPPPSAPPPCAYCTDTQTAGMVNDGQACATYTWAFANRCNKNSNWIANRYCEISCEANGVGYTDPPCCANSAALPPPPPGFGNQNIGSGDTDATIGGVVAGMSGLIFACFGGGYYYYRKKKQKDDIRMTTASVNKKTSSVQSPSKSVSKPPEASTKSGWGGLIKTKAPAAEVAMEKTAPPVPEGGGLLKQVEIASPEEVTVGVDDAPEARRDHDSDDAVHSSTV